MVVRQNAYVEDIIVLHIFFFYVKSVTSISS
jgi:hypothetical protein